ncbi:PH domain-containing protein [Pseudoclavibacter terrae]|uniref:PH domain-containing protein n=1 Tax=Pseudoclavibacter terrae TaxID=1530195 RepID=UPI00232B600A|nr:PH domain-containing protein [Pseudoclavibacter terrae]
MRGRPPHPSEQSWDQIFGAPASAQPSFQQYPGQPAPGQYPNQHPSQPAQQQVAHSYTQYPQHGDPSQQYGSQQYGSQQYDGYAQPDSGPQRHYEPLGMRLPERTVMRVRRHGRRLLLPSLILIAGFGAAGYNLGALQEATIGARHAWLLVSLAAIVLLGIVPVVMWLQARNRITTHRVVLSHGTLTSENREIPMNAIVDVTVRRNLWQAMFRSGTIVITSVSGQRLRLVDVPSANSVAACIRELSGP